MKTPTIALAILAMFLVACPESVTKGVQDTKDVETTAAEAVEGDVPPEAAEIEEQIEEFLEDAEVQVICDSPPYAPYCPCKENLDCGSGYCISTSAGQQCAKPCTQGAECGPLEVCAQVATYPDVIYMCVELYPTLCRPCLNDQDCHVDFAPGDAQPKCVALVGPEDGLFCVSPCSSDGTCPKGYTCADGGRDQGKGCFADAGQCSCSPVAIAAAAQTSCLVTNEFGACPGERHCSAEGLTKCKGPVATPEECNGKDDDCDGKTDEAFAPDPCDLTNPFGTCKGETACTGGQITCAGEAPMAEECNALDEDCDGLTDEDFPDTDSDGIADCVDVDKDGDGVIDVEDNCPDVPNADQTDTDGDKSGDACDVDDDDDGVMDPVDNCPLTPNKEQGDADKDTAGDACDCDADGDGVPNAAAGCPEPLPADNCWLVPNPDQGDANGNGIGDVCDADADGDGVLNLSDNCPLAANPGQEDFDQDGFGDVCDADADNDKVPDLTDNCVFVPNPDQSDLNGDGKGDACDEDMDGDGIPNEVDNCPGTINPDQLDENGNGIGDACEKDWDGDGIPNPDDNCPKVPNPTQDDIDDDKTGDSCDCDIDGDGAGNVNPGCPVPEVPDNCPYAENADQADLDGDTMGDACDPDIDGDGEANDTDCEPANNGVFHGALEACDGIDNNCSGTTDEGPAQGCTLFYLDADADGYGVTGKALCRCAPFGQYSAEKPGDCDDGAQAVYPGAQEVCNGLDDDCNGVIDELGATGCTTFFYDGDSDGHGTAAASKCLCAAAAPYSSQLADDCNDADGASYPGAKEKCDGADNDCDGQTDEEGATGCVKWYKDADEDGYGVSADSLCLCGKAAPYTASLGGDCNDADPGVHGGVKESCNGVDDDCNGAIDDGPATGCSVFYKDADGDGHGNAGDSLCRCAAEGAYTSKAPDDCDDADAKAYPGATEACNGKDDDCDGSTDEGAATGCKQFYLDADGDGYGAGTGVCLCAAAPPYSVAKGGDCDDNKTYVSPGAPEVCDTLDNDCDGQTDEENATGCFWYYKDGDADGYGAKGSGRCLCAPEAGWTVWSNGDCNDANASIYPGAPSACLTAAECCAPADTCVAGICFKGGPKCTTDQNCPSDYYCNAGTCVPWCVGPGGCSSPTCTRPTVPGIFHPLLQCKWTSPPAGDPKPTANNVIPTPVVADFDFDNNTGTVKPSIVISSNSGTACDDPNDFGNGWIRVIDGATCSQQFVITDYEVVGATPEAVGDLDGDGRPEIVANAKGGGLVAFKYNNATQKWGLLWHSTLVNGSNDTTAATSYRWNGPSIFDVDDDNKPEVLMGAMMYNNQGKAIAANLGWKPNTGTGQVPVVADVDGDGKGELVTGEAVWGYVAGTGWVKESYFTATGLGDGFVALADFGAYTVAGLGTNGLPEIVVTGGGTARVQTLSGAVIFGPITLPFFPPATGAGYGGPPTVGDFDGDGKPEFAMAGTGSYTIFDFDCNKTPPPFGCYAKGILWSTPSRDYSSSMTGSSVFDFEGDGKAEAIYGDECYARVYDGNTGEVLFSQPRTSGTWYENPIVADADGDFRSELIYGSDFNCNITCTGADFAYDMSFRGLKCQKDSDCPGEKVGSCKTGYCRCAVDADCGTGTYMACTDPLPNTPGTGKVCRTKHPGQLAGLYVFKDIGDAWVASRPIWNQHAYYVTNVNDNGTIPASGAVKKNWQTAGLNNFRQNVVGSMQPTLAPDLTVKLGVLGNCDAKGNLSVTANVCNRGAAPVAQGLSVAFTLGDPMAGGEVVCLKKTTKDLFPGLCESLSCTYVPGDKQAITIGVYADYGGAKGEATECREDNNSVVQGGVTCKNL